MTPAEIIFSRLRGLVNDRVYPMQFPQEWILSPGTIPGQLVKPTWPSIKYQELTGFNPPDIMGTGDENTDDKTYQIDVVAQHYGTMRALVRSVIAAMEDTDPPNTRDFFAEEPDEETKTYRGILRYTFYASTPAGSPT